MMNLLLWRPQRLRVLVTKLAALLVGLAALTRASSRARGPAVFALIASLRGSAGQDDLRRLAVVRADRSCAASRLVLVAGAVGFGLASLGRHTAMALGVGGRRGRGLPVRPRHRAVDWPR